jgi:hypothetical protein
VAAFAACVLLPVTSFAQVRPSLPPDSPFGGGVPQGTVTSDTLKLSVLDVIKRALEHNLGALLAAEDATDAAGSRKVALSDLMPHVSGRVSQERRKLAAVKGEALVWNSAMPEIQRETLNGEVLALSRYLDVAEDQIADLQSAYIVAEDALRQIQQEEGVPVMRHVAVFGLPFDAVTVKNDVLVCADVMFLVTPDARQEKVDAAVRKMTAVRRSAPRNGGLETRLMLILVTQLTPADEQTLRSVLKTKRFSETPVDIDIRLLDFETLQRIYVTE